MEDAIAENVDGDTEVVIIKQESFSQSQSQDENSHDWSSQACHIQADPTEALAFEDVQRLLLGYEGSQCYVQAALPKAGESYIYDTSLLGDTWEEDRYEWVDAGIEEILGSDGTAVTKTTYYVKASDCVQGCMDFQRVMYYLDAHPNIILVSYVGSEKVYKNKPFDGDKSKKLPSMTLKRKRGRPRKSEADDESRAKSMEIEEAVDMLENYEDCISRSVAQFPKGGEIYYYDTNVVGETWKYDGYIWRNSGKRNIPKVDPQYEKTFYTIRLDETSYDGCTIFQRIVFRALKRPNIVLVQYAGDDSIWQTAKMTNNIIRMKTMFEISAEELAAPPTPAVTTDRSHELTWQEAAQVLRSHEGRAAKNRPFQPKAGEGYIFYLKAKMKEAFKYDGYDWLKDSHTYYPKERPKMSKKTFLIKTQGNPSGSSIQFQKSVYSMLENLTIALVHYHGDETVVTAQSGSKRPAEEELSNEVIKTPKVEEVEDVADPSEGIKNRSLRLQEVLDLLNNCEGNISHSRAIRPKSGEIYIFNTEIIGEDWKCDNYVWRNSGTNYQPKKNPLVRKVFFSIRLDEKVRSGSKAFQKAVYSLIARPNIVMVHYFGDESVYTALMHGNRKKGFVEYTRTVPSVMHSIKKAIVETSGSTPKNTLKHLEVAYNLDETPRNLDQIRNTKRLLAKKKMVVNSSHIKSEGDMHEHLGVDVLQYVSQSDTANLMNGKLVLMNANNEEQIVEFASGAEGISLDQSLAGNEVIYIQADDQMAEQSGENMDQVEIVFQESVPESDTHQAVAITEQAQDTAPDLQMHATEQNVTVTEAFEPEPDLEPDTEPEQSMEDPPTDASFLDTTDAAEDVNDTTVASEASTTATATTTEAQIVDMNMTTSEELRDIVSDKKMLVIQALDPRPEVCATQLELLRQQRRNLELEERKLQLELRQLEERERERQHTNNQPTTNAIMPHTATEAIMAGHGTTGIKLETLETPLDEGAAGDTLQEMPTVLSDENVIYMNSEDYGDLDPSQMGQVIYIEGSGEGLLEHSEVYTDLQQQN